MNSAFTRRAALMMGAGLILMGCKQRRGAQPAGTRIVALSPAVAIILRDLGHGDLVVGRHGYDMVLPETLPVCGNQLGIDYERLIEAAPTHIITEWGASGPPERLVKLAAERGWKLHDASMRTLADIRRETEAVERFIGGDGAKSAALIARLDRSCTERDAHLATAGRVLMLAEIAPPAALGPGSFHFEILVNLGGVAAVPEGGSYQVLTLEQIALMKPDAIVLVLPRAPRETSLEGDAGAARRALGKIAELGIPAVVNGKIALVDDPLSQTPSTAMIAFADRLRALLDGWATK